MVKISSFVLGAIVTFLGMKLWDSRKKSGGGDFYDFDFGKKGNYNFNLPIQPFDVPRYSSFTRINVA